MISLSEFLNILSYYPDDSFLVRDQKTNHAELFHTEADVLDSSFAQMTVVAFDVMLDGNAMLDSNAICYNIAVKPNRPDAS